MDISEFEFYIGHEYQNPLKIFYYKPLRITSNTLRAEILNNIKISFDKEYSFYFSVDGINFSFVGKPLEQNSERDFTFLIKESRIELRRYPRIDVDDPNIRVRVNDLEGYIKDISLGGCKVQFLNNLPPHFYKQHQNTMLTIELPDAKPVTIPAKLVNVNPSLNTASFAFASRDVRVIKLYNNVINYLRQKMEEV